MLPPHAAAHGADISSAGSAWLDPPARLFQESIDKLDTQNNCARGTQFRRRIQIRYSVL